MDLGHRLQVNLFLSISAEQQMTARTVLYIVSGWTVIIGQHINVSTSHTSIMYTSIVTVLIILHIKKVLPYFIDLQLKAYLQGNWNFMDHLLGNVFLTACMHAKFKKSTHA